MAAAIEDDEITDTFSQISTKLAPCDWRSTLFQVESFTPSTESTAESDTIVQVSYHPDWYSVGYLTDGRYNSSSFSKTLPKPQTCNEITPFTRHSMLIFSESECDFNVHFSTKVALQAAEIKRYPRVLRILPDPISAVISTRTVLNHSILIHIEPLLKETASKIERKHRRLENNLITEQTTADIKRLELSPVHTLEVFGSMQKTVRSLKIAPTFLSSEEKTISYLYPVNRVQQKAFSLTNSKVPLDRLKTVPSRGEVDQCVSGRHWKTPSDELNYCIAKPLTGHISGRAFIQECFRPNILQPSLPHSQKEARLMQQIEVIPHNVAEVEVVSEKPCTGRPENRSPPSDSASPCLSFYLIPEKRPSGQITLDVKCCPASSKAMLDALPVDGANRVECRFLKLISQKAKAHRHKPLRLRTEECNVATPSPPQNYCAITLSD
ncbi:hypothetical protein TSMEX_006795 [Taenia solium]|eukprot:TsM_001090200 transcript=TsM_001090200 gene=TsM_001090200